MFENLIRDDIIDHVMHLKINQSIKTTTKQTNKKQQQQKNKQTKNKQQQNITKKT